MAVHDLRRRWAILFSPLMRADRVFHNVPVVSGDWSTSLVATISASDLSSDVLEALKAAADFWRAVEIILLLS